MMRISIEEDMRSGKDEFKNFDIKSYLLTALFNAGSTMSSYYKAMVNHDMLQFAG